MAPFRRYRRVRCAMQWVNGRIRAVLGVAMLVFASTVLTSPPAEAHSRAYRHCYWSHHQRHCHSHRAYPHHRYDRRCTWRHPFRRCSAPYRHRPGWNNRY